MTHPSIASLFFFNDPPTTEIYTLSLHDALPIYHSQMRLRALEQPHGIVQPRGVGNKHRFSKQLPQAERSEEHTSELQSHSDLVCRLLLEKKKPHKIPSPYWSSGLTH